MPSIKLARHVQPERLDFMPADDPLARRSRCDLQRVHRVMRSLTILRQAVGMLRLSRQPRRILELGAGDGSMMLRLARSAVLPWSELHVTFLDRHDLIGADSRRQFALLGWEVRVLTQDVLDWARTSSAERYDLCITTLFLHHFRISELHFLLGIVAARCRAFIACEPRRNRYALLGSHLLGLLGANEVTREDGVTSVAAGFTGRELSSLWPCDVASWWIREYYAWPFTHCFIARANRHAGARWDEESPIRLEKQLPGTERAAHGTP